MLAVERDIKGEYYARMQLGARHHTPYSIFTSTTQNTLKLHWNGGRSSAADRFKHHTRAGV